MTLFLRDKKNNTLCECDFFTNDGSLDVSCSVSIINYTKFLVHNIQYAQTIAKIFEDLSQMRGLLWETYTNVMGKDYDMDRAIGIARLEFEKVAVSFNLCVVED